MKSTTIRPTPVVQAAAMAVALSTAMCHASYVAESLRRLVAEIDEDNVEGYVIGTVVPMTEALIRLTEIQSMISHVNLAIHDLAFLARFKTSP